MSKIATEQEVYNVGQTGTPIANKCCTKQRMEALGCTGTNGVENYQNNRPIIGANNISSSYYSTMVLYKFLGFKEALTEEQIQAVIKKYNLLDGVDEIEVS